MRLEDTLLAQFVAHTKKIKKKLNRETPHPITVNAIRFEDIPCDFSQGFPQQFGVKYENGTMLISRELPQEIVEGVVAREAFIQFIPNAISSIPQSYDLAMEYGRLHTRSEKRWLTLWQETSTSLRVEGFFYYPPHQFPILTKASKGNFLWDFMKRIFKLDDYRLKIPLPEYIQLYGEYRLFFIPRLTEKEVRLLQILLNQKSIDKQEIAQRMKISQYRVTSMITNLIEKEVIYRYLTVNFRKLGFNSYYIYYNGSVDYKDRILNVFYNNSRYKYALHKFIDGSATFLMILLAPDTPKFFSNLLVKCERESKIVNGTLMCFKRLPNLIPVHNYNFTTYNVKTARWNIDWFSWYISAKRILEKLHTMPIGDYFESATDVFDLKHITPLDLQIIDYVIGYGNLNRRKLREYVRKSTNVIQERIKFLKSHKIIYYKTFARTIGLTEYTSIFIQTMNHQLLNGLKIILEMLPYTIIDLVTGTFSSSYSTTDILSGAMILIATPQGQAIIFERYLRQLLENYNIWVHITTAPKRGVWKLPIESWDDKQKRWRID